MHAEAFGPKAMTTFAPTEPRVVGGRVGLPYY
jgi:hypothetical protein